MTLSQKLLGAINRAERFSGSAWSVKVLLGPYTKRTIEYVQLWEQSIQSKIIEMAFSMAAEIESLLSNGSTQKFIARRYHTTAANLHNWLKKRGLK
jgi:hypothetical protein